MDKSIVEISKKTVSKYNLPIDMFLSILATETGGQGFDSTTGKIIIQFEPSWFKKKAPYAPSGLWSVNGVERQSKEWLAFNDAFSKNREAAMQATSIGLGQIMGFNYKLLGFKSVGDMWDDAKKGLGNQLEQICKFICSNNKLKQAVIKKDTYTIAYIYNGANFIELAKRIPREPYNITLEKNLKLFEKL